MKHFTIFGNPLSHSISPLMHTYALKDLNLKGEYLKHELIDGTKLKETFFDLSLDGANVTIPHKEIAYKQCDEIKGVAKSIKAVNTLIKRDKNLIGYNTDAPGFLMSIQDFLPLDFALVIGAGGTAKALSYALLKKGVCVEILNRSEGRLKDFKDFSSFTWDTFSPKKYDIIINTTSAGLHDNDLPAPKKLLLPTLKLAKYSFDVIYHKQTPFNLLSKELDKPFKDGKNMLLYQGVLAFNLFFDNRLNESLITKAMQKAFN